MKNIKIKVPKGFEIDKYESTFENIVLKKIKNEPSKKWHKIFEGSWREENGSISKYNISYIADTVLDRVRGSYTILKTYNNKQTMIDCVVGDNSLSH